LLFKHAINRGASSVIVTHNHPSGNLSPSQEDIRLTERLQEAGKILEIPVLDHLIVAETGYFSFADQGLLKT
jgi:DNA repair protein RadC